jgi:hypothetical protein
VAIHGISGEMIVTRKPAYTIEELLQIHPGGRTRLYDAIKAGQLIARKIGRQTIVLDDEYTAYLQSLPKIEPKREAVS